MGSEAQDFQESLTASRYQDLKDGNANPGWALSTKPFPDPTETNPEEGRGKRCKINGKRMKERKKERFKIQIQQRQTAENKG